MTAPRRLLPLFYRVRLKTEKGKKAKSTKKKKKKVRRENEERGGKRGEKKARAALFPGCEFSPWSDLLVLFFCWKPKRRAVPSGPGAPGAGGAQEGPRRCPPPRMGRGQRGRSAGDAAAAAGEQPDPEEEEEGNGSNRLQHCLSLRRAGREPTSPPRRPSRGSSARPRRPRLRSPPARLRAGKWRAKAARPCPGPGPERGSRASRRRLRGEAKRGRGRGGARLTLGFSSAMVKSAVSGTLRALHKGGEGSTERGGGERREREGEGKAGGEGESAHAPPRGRALPRACARPPGSPPPPPPQRGPTAHWAPAGGGRGRGRGEGGGGGGRESARAPQPLHNAAAGGGACALPAGCPRAPRPPAGRSGPCRAAGIVLLKMAAGPRRPTPPWPGSAPRPFTAPQRHPRLAPRSPLR